MFCQEECWSGDESKLVVVMEASKNESAEGSEGSDNNSKKTCKKFELSEDWGESFIGKCDPTMVIIDFEKRSFQAIDSLPFCPAQPLWISDDKLICIGLDNFPRKYGIVYCYNRCSSIYIVNSVSKEFGRIK